MKSHTKLALVLCAIVSFPFLSANATTFQVQVGQRGQKFNPANITIAPGDTIEWIWAGNDHSTTSGTPGNPDGLWDSGVQNSGFTFSYTFNTAGTFSYICTPHPFMKGTVIVQAASTGGSDNSGDASGTAGTGGSGTSPPKDDGGCSVAATPVTGGIASLAGAALLGLVLATRRRSRR